MTGTEERALESQTSGIDTALQPPTGLEASDMAPPRSREQMVDDAGHSSVRGGGPVPTTSPRSVSQPLDLGLRHYLRLGLRYKKLIIAVLLATMAITVVRIVLKPRLYIAKATILPSGGQSQGGVLGLIASFTGTPPAGALSEETSSLLFPSILESRVVGLEVLRSTYRFEKNGEQVEMTLEEMIGAESTDKALKVLRHIASFDVNKETGTLTVAASTMYPELSAQIANRFVDSLERLNLEMRRVAATQNSSFIQERLDESHGELTLAEQKLTEFREQNVRMNSAELELERMRLERDVALKSQIFISLANQAELAEIEETKDLPVVRVLDRAAVPNMPVPVPKLSSLVLGMIVGVLMAIMSVAAVEIFHYLRGELAWCTASLSGDAK
jgi:uncharacterized protein involved in exopolysaccharide biosynthesis